MPGDALQLPHPSAASNASMSFAAAFPPATASFITRMSRPVDARAPRFPTCSCRAHEFKALQQHIDELTQEKFMLQVRCAGGCVQGCWRLRTGCAASAAPAA